MPRRGLPETSRTGRNRLTRGASAAVLGLVSVFALGQSLSQVLVQANPSFALKLAPFDARAMAAVADDDLSQNLVRGKSSAALSMAQRAALLDPTAVKAINVLGLHAEIDGETGRAQSLFNYSLRLSRREQRSQLWAIEEAVTRGDIGTALTKYDLLLRTSRDAVSLLFPTLAASVGTTRVQTKLFSVLRSKPIWDEDFINFLTRSSQDPSLAGEFLALANRQGLKLPVDDEDRAAVVDNFLAKSRYSDAWNFYVTFRGDARIDASRDTTFFAGNETPSAFDWRLTQDLGAYASVLQAADMSGLSYSLPAGIGGDVVRQLLVLPIGSYRVDAEASALEPSTGAGPEWTLTCLDGRLLGRNKINLKGRGDAGVEDGVSVPANCPVQTFALSVKAIEAISGQSGTINRLGIRPRNPSEARP